MSPDKELDLAESELSRANMMLIYEKGFKDPYRMMFLRTVLESVKCSTLDMHLF